MAGIGFELRNILQKQTFASLLRAYGYAALISSGPWILSILAVMGIGMLSVGRVPSEGVRQFLVSVTYLMATTLIFTGFLQLMFTRFIADQLFAKRTSAVVPNMLGALAVTAAAGGALASAIVGLTFAGSVLYRLLMVAGFVVVSQTWIVVVLLSGLKEYRKVLGVFVMGYAVSAGGAVLGRPFGTEGLLGGFLLGQAVMLYAMIALVARNYPTDRAVSFEFLSPKKAYYSLFVTGFLYNLGIWADKLVFWANPATSSEVLGPLRASMIYDTPIFLAYLSIAPGMAVFLVRVETDFAEQYDRFFKAVREGDTLANIERIKGAMVDAVGQGINEILRVQGLTVMILILAAPKLLPALGISPLYVPLFCVYLVGTGMQVLMLAVFNVLFYLDQRYAALALSLLFASLNFALTAASQTMGPSYYGYGFAVSATITSVMGIFLASSKLAGLEYRTFMLQR